MPVHRFPVMVWQDFEGYHTACAVDRGDEAVAVAKGAEEAVSRVRQYLAWHIKKEPWFDEPDFVDARLVHIPVKARPRYTVKDHKFPCNELVTLNVPCVHGRREAGLLVCALPTLGVSFDYYEADALRRLVSHHVQEKLSGLTPQQVSRYLPPKSVSLHEIVIRAPRRKREYGWALPLKLLRQVAEPLGDRKLRRGFSRAWERDKEVADLVYRLGTERASVIIVGESGVGKTTVLVEGARKLERQKKRPVRSGDEESPRARNRFWLTSASRLIAGMKYLGQWQERCEQVIDELSDCDGFLCAENLLDLLRIGGEGPGDSIAAFLLPYVQRGELRMVAEATPAELDACRRLLPGFADLFQVLKLPEFDRGAALRVLGSVADSRRQDLRVEMEKGVVELTHNLFGRFVPYQAFPGRAARFLDEVFERASLEGKKAVTIEQASDHFVRQTGLPEAILRDDMPLGRAEVLDFLKKHVIGQQSASEAAASLVTTFKAGLNDPQRPVGVMLFCGPTGVGKTELAKSIARFLFGHGDQPDRLVRLDMSEYGTPGAARRLIGEPDGEPSDLIKKLRQQPFVVLLLDEIEKAAPEVFDILLGVFDEGRLTDRYGRTTMFRSAIIVMTSNLGSEKHESIGFGDHAGPDYEAEAMSFFRPEFFNRIDAVVTFNPLGEETIHAITRKELAEVARREGLTKADIRLTWSEELVKHLAREGFDRRYGARPLQRTIETLVVALLARYLVEHQEIESAELGLDTTPEGKVVFRIVTL